MLNRSSGILMHISSLPSKYGIGDFGKEAYNFVDFLVNSNQKNWQILPLGVTGYGNSPYQCFSAFAGNPYFIDLDELINKGFLSLKEIEEVTLGSDLNNVDYGILYENKLKLLRNAYNSAKVHISNELDKFLILNKKWLREFSIFMALKEKFDNKKWNSWDSDYKQFNSDAILDFEKYNKDSIGFWVFTQYLFFNQWQKLKEYANSRGISIIGDLPIYVAEDSADAWANPKIFNLDKDCLPITVAGCPPDDFSKTGQLWGNPIYDWEEIEKDDYAWWIDRFRHSFILYDFLRIDHFRGFEAYWEVKYGSDNAINGRWVKGPGIKLFNKAKQELGDLNIIAEDLGYYSDDLRKLLEATGFPGMKVLQFAFDTNGDSDHLPHNYHKNTVVYTGTHDNAPILSWFDKTPRHEIDFAIDYLKLNDLEGMDWGFIRGVWSSTANLAIAQMQDFLGLGREARMNEPSTEESNWTWRLNKSDLIYELSKRISELTILYRRK